MKFGTIQEIFDAKNTTTGLPLVGMPLEHMQAFQDASTKLGKPIMVRGVNPSSRALISSGVASKGFHAKMKSSKVFPAGLIEAVESEDLKNALENGYRTEQLVMTKEWFNQYVADGLIKIEEEKLVGVEGEISKKIRFTWEEKTDTGTKTYSAFAETYFDQYKITYSDGRPFQILVKDTEVKEIVGGRPVTRTVPLPVTADYDIFAILTPFAYLSPKEIQSPVHVQGSQSQVKERLKDTKEDPHKGNVSRSTLQDIKAINDSIQARDSKRDSKNPMVHHNTDIYNPFASALAKDIPMFMVFEKPVNLGELSDNKPVESIIMETVDDVVAVYHKMWELGYYLPQNAKIPEFDHINSIIKELSSDKEADVGELPLDIRQRIKANVSKRLQEEKKPKEKTLTDEEKRKQVREQASHFRKRTAIRFGSAEKNTLLDEEKADEIEAKKIKEEEQQQRLEELLLSSSPTPPPTASSSMDTSPPVTASPEEGVDKKETPLSPSSLYSPVSPGEEDSEEEAEERDEQTSPHASSFDQKSVKKSSGFHLFKTFKSKLMPAATIPEVLQAFMSPEQLTRLTKKQHGICKLITKLEKALDNKDYSEKQKERYRKLLVKISNVKQQNNSKDGILLDIFNLLQKRYEVIFVTKTIPPSQPPRT